MFSKDEIGIKPEDTILSQSPFMFECKDKEEFNETIIKSKSSPTDPFGK